MSDTKSILYVVIYLIYRNLSYMLKSILYVEIYLICRNLSYI